MENKTDLVVTAVFVVIAFTAWTVLCYSEPTKLAILQFIK